LKCESQSINQLNKQSLISNNWVLSCQLFDTSIIDDITSGHDLLFSRHRPACAAHCREIRPSNRHSSLVSWTQSKLNRSRHHSSVDTKFAILF